MTAERDAMTFLFGRRRGRPGGRGRVVSLRAQRGGTGPSRHDQTRNRPNCLRLEAQLAWSVQRFWTCRGLNAPNRLRCGSSTTVAGGQPHQQPRPGHRAGVGRRGLDRRSALGSYGPAKQRHGRGEAVGADQVACVPDGWSRRPGELGAFAKHDVLRPGSLAFGSVARPKRRCFSLSTPQSGRARFHHDGLWRRTLQAAWTRHPRTPDPLPETSRINPPVAGIRRRPFRRRRGSPCCFAAQRLGRHTIRPAVRHSG